MLFWCFDEIAITGDGLLLDHLVHKREVAMIDSLFELCRWLPFDGFGDALSPVSESHFAVQDILLLCSRVVVWFCGFVVAWL